MNVRLIAHTPNPDELCARAAAVCYAAKAARKSLEHALASGHDSVAEHATFTFLIEGVSRALLAQLTRHRIASFSVQSQRYVDMSRFDFVMPPSIQAHPTLRQEFFELIDRIKSFYDAAVEEGIPKEDARFVLPNACGTQITMTMNARELRHFFSLRCCNRAQWEIRELADEMLKLCKEVAPMLFADAGPGCVRGKCPEKRPCGNPRGGESE